MRLEQIERRQRRLTLGARAAKRVRNFYANQAVSHAHALIRSWRLGQITTQHFEALLWEQQTAIQAHYTELTRSA